jgi:hypothetical protein
MRNMQREVPYENRNEEQSEHDRISRKKTVIVVADHAKRHRLTSSQFLEIIEVLGLESDLAAHRSR